MNTALELIFDNIDLLAKGFDAIRYDEEMEEYEIDTHLKPLCDILNANVSQFKMPVFKKLYYNSKNHFAIGNSTLVLFNGGKASLATAIEAKRQIDPLLFYVKNMDPKFARCAYPQEQAVRDLAKRLDLPLVVQKIKCDPKNPLYRAKIFNLAIKYAIENGCPMEIWTGTFDGVSIRNNPFRFFQNSIEFKDCYSILIKSILTDFKIVTPLPSSSYMWDVLMSNRGLAKDIFSETSFDKILSYLYSIDYNLIEEEDANLYMKYMERLRREYIAERGIPPKRIEDLWKRYFFYNIYKSKHHKELMEFLE